MDNLPSDFPPLLGDTKGRFRVHIVGSSGVGKSTVGEALSRILGVPYISMDKIKWKPGWESTPREEFQARLRAALDQDPRGWVSDGNYESRGGLMAFEESTDVIWLDPPLALYLPRLIWRTVSRLLGLGEPCSPGCDDRFSEVFLSRNSIIWWCISHHWKKRRRYRERMIEYGLASGRNVEKRKMRRLGGWGGELKTWLKRVEDMVRSK